MKRWVQVIAEKIGTQHSDTVAVVRAGKGAKRRTRRRDRQRAKRNLIIVESRDTDHA